MDLKIIYGIGLGILVITLVLFFVFLSDADHSLIIHFDKFVGIDLWGKSSDVLKIIIFGFIVQGLNMGLAYNLSKKRIFPVGEVENEKGTETRKVLPYTLGFINIFIAVLILIAVGVIISVN
jgi:hypothetical protein